MASCTTVGVTPVAGPTFSYWRKDGGHLENFRSTSDLPRVQDIVIIGSGLTGAACAYYISQTAGSSSIPTTTVLEAREVCSGATGRNGGHLRPEALASFSKFSETLGLDSANEIALFEVANAEAVKELVQTEGIDCDYTQVESANVYLDGSLASAAKSQIGELARSGYDIVGKIQFHENPHEAEDVTGVLGAKAAATFPAASIWPYKLAVHLLKIAMSKGVQLQTHTPAQCISSTPNDNGYWVISTPRGDMMAKTVIFATNGYTPNLLPEYAGTIIPVRGICSHIQAVNTSNPAPVISETIKTMGIKHSPGCQDYLITRPDGSIVVGGAWKAVRPGPRDDWYNVIDDSQLIPAAVNYYDGFMQRTFATWENEPSEVDYLWTGIMGV
ncbi:uncharacterized protein E0L32_006677 [Thyridium curvatum]|uniref:FAD dependent oxidoreductase domain-containing protein n=1 Tax=Thyridium curvatum TaxID=1093900 RepID=A0A507AZ50_9PEZI|nr:uncharacterized protein E0L32_006677 [Thyridium curvatum]TPX12797.1 hypothetical protein E0L32_006677 [Thyridium curvatum]